jgi:ferrous iron transport protein B
VGTLATVYSVEEGSDVSESGGLASVLKREWSAATGLSLLVWFIFAPMCISTLATIRRELGGSRYVFLSLAYLFGLAYLGSFLTYRFFSS